MRKSRNINLISTTSILSKIDEISTERSKEKLIFLIHYLINSPNMKKGEDNPYHSLKGKKIVRVLDCNPYRYVKILLKNEIIERDKYYIPGEKSYKYRITDKFKYKMVYYELLPESQLFKRIIEQNYRSKTNNSRFPHYIKEMNKKLMKLEFDFEGARQLVYKCEDPRKQLSYMIAINNLQDKRFRWYNIGDQNGRYYSNFTNLKSDYRPFIKGDFICYDLKNSQILLFNHILQSLNIAIVALQDSNIEPTLEETIKFLHGSTLSICLNKHVIRLVKKFGIQRFNRIRKIRKNRVDELNTNFSKFDKWANSGSFYEIFAEKSGYGLSKDEMKKIVYAVFFSANITEKTIKGKKMLRYIPYEKEKKVFAKTFPVIYEIIKLLKEKEHNKFAIFLQKTESIIFIDKISKELVDIGIVPFTLHDSIVIEREHQDKTKEVIDKVFLEELGYIPQFHHTNLADK